MVSKRCLALKRCHKGVVLKRCQHKFSDIKTAPVTSKQCHKGGVKTMSDIKIVSQWSGVKTMSQTSKWCQTSKRCLKSDIKTVSLHEIGLKWVVPKRYHDTSLTTQLDTKKMPEFAKTTMLGTAWTCASNVLDAREGKNTTTLDRVRTDTRATREPRLLAALPTYPALYRTHTHIFMRDAI